MLSHQDRLNTLISEVQAKHKSLYTNHRRLEEDITKMLGSNEFEHAKTIPCKQIRQTFDAADLELEALKQGLLAIDLSNFKSKPKKTSTQNPQNVDKSDENLPPSFSD